MKDIWDRFGGDDDDDGAFRFDGGDEDGYGGFDRGIFEEVAETVQPESFIVEEDYCRVGEDYTRTIYWHAFPPNVPDGWLARFLRYEEPLHLSIAIQPLPKTALAKRFRRQAAQDEAAVNKEVEQGFIPNHQRQQRLAQTKALIQAIEEDRTKPFQVMIAMRLRAKTLKELDRITQQLESRITSGATRRARFRQREGFEATLPFLVRNELYDTTVVRFMHTQGVTTLFPFINADINHEKGVLLGVSRTTNAPILFNRFQQPGTTEAREAPWAPMLANANVAILAQSGKGKSFLAKLESLRWGYKGNVNLLSIDPSGEWRPIIEALGGQSIRLSLDSRDRINPLDFSFGVATMGDEEDLLAEKIKFMVEFLTTVIRSQAEGNERVSIDPQMKSIFGQVLRETYKQFGYLTQNPASLRGAKPEKMPTLSHFMKNMDIAQRRHRGPAQAALLKLISYLEPFHGDGHMAGLFDHISTVDLTSPYVSFNLASLDEKQYTMVMYLLLDFLRTKLFTEKRMRTRERTLLTVDEAQNMMSYPETAGFLSWIVRNARKYSVGVTVLTQEVQAFTVNADGSENRLGVNVLSNCETTILMSQHPKQIDTVKDYFKLTEQQASTLMAGQPGDGLLLLGDGQSVWFASNGMVNPLENQLCSTTASERADIDERPREIESGGGPDALPPGHDKLPPEDDFDPFGSDWH